MEKKQKFVKYIRNKMSVQLKKNVQNRKHYVNTKKTQVTTLLKYSDRWTKIK